MREDIKLNTISADIADKGKKGKGQGIKRADHCFYNFLQWQKSWNGSKSSREFGVPVPGAKLEGPPGEG